MPYFKDKFLILNNKQFKEKDIIILILSKLRGKYEIVVKGVKGLKSRFRGASEPFMLCEGIIHYKSGIEYYTLNSVDIMDSFCTLDDESMKLKYGYYILTVLNEFLPYNMVIKNLFDGIINFLNHLKNSKDYEATAIQFVIWFIKKMGYEPNLEYCANCNKKIYNEFILDVESHSVICSNCIKKKYIKFSETVLKFLKNKYSHKSINLNDFIISEYDRKNIKLFFDCYINIILDRSKYNKKKQILFPK